MKWHPSCHTRTRDVQNACKLLYTNRQQQEVRLAFCAHTRNAWDKNRLLSTHKQRKAGRWDQTTMHAWSTSAHAITLLCTRCAKLRDACTPYQRVSDDVSDDKTYLLEHHMPRSSSTYMGSDTLVAQRKIGYFEQLHGEFEDHLLALCWGTERTAGAKTDLRACLECSA